MSWRNLGLLGLPLVLAAAIAVQVTAAAPQGKVAYGPRKVITNPDGAAVFADYCSVCHGPTGKGDGRAARYLDTPVPDLTRIAARHGKFDPNMVMAYIERRDGTVADPMPCWGRVLRTASGNPEVGVLVLRNLTRHIESLQASR